MNQQESLKQHNWKKIIFIGVVAIITPGGFIALGAYGIKKFLERKKEQNVQTERP